ncbi:hypothetical protein EDB85DRAFT_304679 [Lactarius pseudohatsudake]|nr:hypothetical protein EDB85DRAFT_304679 [Lactarius pseudohatsudake]
MDTGRAYRRQAMELVMACRLLVEISPQEAQHDALFKEVMLAADEALRSATKAGKKITDEASVAFIEAQRRILQYEATAHPKSGVLEVAERMTQAKEDRRSLNRRYTLGILDTYHDYDKPTVTVNFILLRSLLGALHDPDPFIVPRKCDSRRFVLE